MGVDARAWADDEYVWVALPDEAPLAVWFEGNGHGDLPATRHATQTS
jgi:hypothetical protein